MPVQLKTLDEYNSSCLEAAKASAVKKNGIACPECGYELYDVSTPFLGQNLPAVKVYCRECGYLGQRYANFDLKEK